MILFPLLKFPLASFCPMILELRTASRDCEQDWELQCSVIRDITPLISVVLQLYWSYFTAHVNSSFNTATFNFLIACFVNICANYKRDWTTFSLYWHDRFWYTINVGIMQGCAKKNIHFVSTLLLHKLSAQHSQYFVCFHSQCILIQVS